MPDQVSIDMGAGHNLIPIEEWLSMPLSQRTRLLIDNRVCFLRGRAIVPVREALGLLKSANGRRPPA